MAQSIKEWERVRFDERVGAAFDKAQVGGGFLGQEPFVAEADEPVGNILSVKSEIFGFKLFAAPPIADADVNKDALLREHVEEGLICCIHD
jgi:hypothetical protein